MLMELERQQIVEYGKKISSEKLTSGTSGNISVYDPETGLMAISPSGIDYFETKPEDIVIMKLDGTIVEGSRKPSSEHNLHIALYKVKKDARSIIHTHSTYCTVLSTLNMPIQAVHYVLADAGSNVVPVAPYVTFGTNELAKVVAESIGEADACLMQNHGMVACGKNMNAAFTLARECEWISEVQWRAMCIGKPNILDKEEMDVVMGKFNNYGQVRSVK